MTKKINFYTVLLFIAHISSFCAIKSNKPKPQPAKIIATIAIHNVQSILPITNNHIALSSLIGCCVWDYSTNKEIFQLIRQSDDSNFHQIILNKNRTKLALSYMNPNAPNDGHLIVYNTSTKEKMLKTTITNNTLNTIPAFSTTNDNAILINALCFNPTKEEYITHRGSIYTLSTMEALFHLDSNFTYGKYSPSGKLIGLCDMYGSCAIFDTQSKEINYLITETNGSCFSIDAIDFDPTSHILAIIPSSGRSIEYWNTKTRKLITISKLSDHYIKTFKNPIKHNRITFFPNGKKIIIATGNQCLILQVPFKIFHTMLGIDTYKLDTKNKCIAFISVLNQFILTPTDIKHLLIYSFLKISKVGDDY